MWQVLLLTTYQDSGTRDLIGINNARRVALGVKTLWAEELPD